MTKVKCTVDSCEFWSDDQICTADQIWVKNDISGNPYDFSSHFINASMTEFGKEVTGEKETKEPVKHNQTSAKTTPQTCCDTMRPKHENPCDCDCE